MRPSKRKNEPGTSESLEPGNSHTRSQRRRLDWKSELALAALPTFVVLSVLALVETFTEQRLLFASLASSAFLIYLDPEHGTNRVRTLIFSQMGAALIGFLCFWIFGAGYFAAAFAIIFTIVGMVFFDVLHPPAVATALSFAFRASDSDNLLLFGLSLALVAVLVGLQRWSVWLIGRLGRGIRP